jgi:hypothetical protein
MNIYAIYLVVVIAWTCIIPVYAASTETGIKPLTLWQQYAKSGEKCMRKGDIEKAKRYYLGALSELEKTKPAKGTPLTGAVSRLEKRILDLYPEEWTIDEDNLSAQLALQEEQVGTFARVNELAHDFKSGNNLTTLVVESRYKKAQLDLQKTKTAIAANGGRTSANKSGRASGNSAQQ